MSTQANVSSALSRSEDPNSPKRAKRSTECAVQRMRTENHANDSRFHVRKWPALCCFLLALIGIANAPSALADIWRVGNEGRPLCDFRTIQEAINATANNADGPDEIRITFSVDDGYYRGERLIITDQDLTLSGGWSSCAGDAIQGARIDISGNTTQGSPVLRIRGGGVVNINNINFTLGNVNGDLGAGIDYRGAGTLRLQNVGLIYNTNPELIDGGAIRFIGTGGAAFLEFSDDVYITDNSSNGMSLSGAAYLNMMSERNFVWNNSGTGLVIDSPAFANIGAPSFDERGVFYRNNIGIFARTPFGGSEDSVVRLFSTDPNRPMSITESRGTAILIWSENSGPADISVCAKNIEIARNGVLNSGVFSEQTISVSGQGAHFELNTECGYPPSAAIDCDISANPRCNVINDNRPSGGNVSLVYVIDGGTAEINRARITGNRASYIFATIESNPLGSNLLVTNSLIARNGDTPLGIVEQSSAQFSNVTFYSDGSRGRMLRFNFAKELSLKDSILISSIIGGGRLMDFSGPNPQLLTINSVLAENFNGIPMGGQYSDLIVGFPNFIPNSFRLAPMAIGVDFSPASGGSDLDGNPRDVDTLNVTNVNGPRDLGAFESQVASVPLILFGDGFE